MNRRQRAHNLTTTSKKLVDALIDSGQVELVDASARSSVVVDLAKALAAVETSDDLSGAWLGGFFQAPSAVDAPLGNLVTQPWFAQLEELDASGLLGPRANEILVRAYGDRLANIRLR